MKEKLFECSFIGRPIGSKGADRHLTWRVYASNADHARFRLSESHEHIKEFSAKEVNDKPLPYYSRW